MAQLPLCERPSLTPETGTIPEGSLKGDTDEPIYGQEKVIYCIELFNKPKPTTTGKGLVYGIMKIRETCRDEEAVKSRIKNHYLPKDDKHLNHFTDVGRWFLITTEPSSTQVDYTVLRQNEKIAERMKVEQLKEEDLRKAREIEERTKEIKERDFEADPESLDFYTLTRVSEMSLQERINQLKAELLRSLKKQQEHLQKCHDIDKKHPEYKDTWIENLNRERKRAGMGERKIAEDDLKRYNSFSETRESKPDAC